MEKFKPTFTVSEKSILWNIHVAAEQAVKKEFPKIKITPIDQFNNVMKHTSAPTSEDFEIKSLINNLFDGVEDVDLTRKNGKYAVYILYALKDKVKKATVINDVKKEIIKVLITYFSKFVSSAVAKNKIKDNDILDMQKPDDDTSDEANQIRNIGLEALKYEYTLGGEEK